MRVISCIAENFASYKRLEFDFSNQGLALISGPTGSGKSTLCDLIPWALFGITSKGGPVSDIISWPGDEVTTVTIYLKDVTISRSRGPKAKDNDLMFWPIDGGVATRGKDLNDTQRLINDFLGMNAELYLVGAYYHEFSQTAQFFTTTPKNRRVLCEQLVDLNLATKLKEKLTEKYKSLDKEVSSVQENIRTLESNIMMLERLQEQEKTKELDWEKQREKTKQYVIGCYDKFESSRKKTVHNKCNECGTILDKPREVVDTSENPHLERLAELESQSNPHKGGVKDFSIEINECLAKTEVIKQKESSLKLELDDLDLLQDVVSTYRSTSIKNTILDLETNTNKLLEKHFDAEIKVAFSVEDADKLDINIFKDGNECSFTQLSKGQRCLLKLCFGISVMQGIQNHHGLSFNQIFFDEALDGLDESMKVKAYGLFETLEQLYEGVFVVEHAESLKTLFSNKFTVELVNGNSEICQH